MADCAVELPNFRVDLERARRALGDDQTMAALAPSDRSFLRGAFDDLLAALEKYPLSEQPLHGEPHEGNRLLTPSGLRWIDFENACWGPLEWDLAYLSEDTVETFAGVDPDLLALLGNLVSARVATWCWVQAGFPEMRRHGAHHLALLRDRWSAGAG
jgi:Ser/Thr protein kinase RdoA (MazF antagonist)